VGMGLLCRGPKITYQNSILYGGGRLVARKRSLEGKWWVGGLFQGAGGDGGGMEGE